MVKKKTPTIRATPAILSGPARSRSFFSRHAIRETIESVVVAFILAFLFRTFDAEAFVIPTGSMAPTLMGQHKDVVCPECGFRYQAGASGEAEDLAQQRGINVVPREVVSTTCPLCRYVANVDPRTAEGRQFPTYGGDRILVSKFNYDFAEPRRWDVTVFKYPGEAQTNYIKRLVGLPGETIHLSLGDLYAQRADEPRPHIERRPAEKLRAMAQLVYDNDYVVDAMTDKGWPVRWQPWPADAVRPGGAWTTGDGSRTYTMDGSATGAQWLRYQHFVPSVDEWNLLQQGSLPQDHQAKPRLITDFYAYDASVSRGDPVKQPQMLGLHWVGDLILECELNVTDEKGNVIFELIKGGRHFRCTFDCSSGQARFSIDGLSEYAPTAQTAVRGRGSHRIAFANIDRQLTLWVDGSSVAFDGETTYDPLDNDIPRSTSQDAGDLAPAGIASSGAAVQVSHLRLWRDIYYIAARNGRLSDYADGFIPRLNYDALETFWSTPEMWNPPGRESPFDQRRPVDFQLEEGQFFVLGDNSPMSQDARLWPAEPYVARQLIVGKALLIFWPHSLNRVPGTSIPFPYFPNFAKMGFIR